jgi:hypothetical protein
MASSSGARLVAREIGESSVAKRKASAAKRQRRSTWRPWAERRLGIGQVHGDTHPQAKMTSRYVVGLRRRAAKVKGTPKAVGFINREAEEMGVTRSAICAAIYGDTWKSLPNALKKRKGQRSLH